MKTKFYNQKTPFFKGLALAALTLLFAAGATAQEMKPMPFINVSGEGKVKVTPDQATISVTVETKGNNAADVKKQNDAAVEKVVQFLKKNLPKEDVQTQRVALNPQYDYDKKKYNYMASQTIEILLKNLDRYDMIMAGLIDSGINRINKVEFQSSKLEMHQSEARKLAIKDAKAKAEDYVSVLGQRVGKAFTINDNTQVYYPQPMYMAEMKANAADGGEVRETVAIGEINITANVTASFVLE
ncbi:MAG TPA: SIMPL domain-containing protein [Flavobacterium sp.]|jgi:hypothetical protein